MDNFGILHHKVVIFFIFFVIFLLFLCKRNFFGASMAIFLGCEDVGLAEKAKATNFAEKLTEDV